MGVHSSFVYISLSPVFFQFGTQLIYYIPGYYRNIPHYHDQDNSNNNPTYVVFEFLEVCLVAVICVIVERVAHWKQEKFIDQFMLIELFVRIGCDLSNV